jgi:hypothetical protein
MDGRTLGQAAAAGRAINDMSLLIAAAHFRMIDHHRSRPRFDTLNQ